MRPLDPRMLRHARATRMYLAACVALGLVTAGLIVTYATLLSHGIAAVHPVGAGSVRGLEGMGWLLAAAAGTVVARAATAWAQEVSAHRAAAAVKSQLRSSLLRHVASLGPAWMTGQRSGELVTLCCTGLDALDAYFSRYLPQLVLAALVPVVILARITPADGVAAVTIMLTLPLIPIFMILIGLHTQLASQRRFRMLARLSHHFLDIVAGLRTLKAYRRTAHQETTIRSVTDAYRTATMRTLRIAFLSSLALELIATLSVALVAVGIGLRLVEARLDFETALLVLILAPEAYLPIRQVGVNYHAATDGLAAAGEIFAILETPVPDTPHRSSATTSTEDSTQVNATTSAEDSTQVNATTSTQASAKASERAGARSPHDAASAMVRMTGVTVTYPERPTPAVSAFDLTVCPGEIVALTGQSGCGKSTVLAAMLGFVHPQAGEVLVCGVPITDIDLKTWRRGIAWVPQRPWLFSGTIADNIRLGMPESSEDAVRRAAEAAGAGAFISALPKGFSTQLGEGGSGLSAGQRQRIALARAFLRDAPLVLLDEPTANLDGGTEAEILDSVRRLALGRTVVVAAHRRALIELADREVAL